MVYLAVIIGDYTDMSLLALHRISEARLLMDGCRRPKGFDLDGCLAEESVAFPVMGFGDKVEVLEPVALWEEFARMARTLGGYYGAV